jgi:hypothetical protein
MSAKFKRKITSKKFQELIDKFSPGAKWTRSQGYIYVDTDREKEKKLKSWLIVHDYIEIMGDFEHFRNNHTYDYAKFLDENY